VRCARGATQVGAGRGVASAPTPRPRHWAWEWSAPTHLLFHGAGTATTAPVRAAARTPARPLHPEVRHGR